jgi:hypothetical protein
MNNACYFINTGIDSSRIELRTWDPSVDAIARLDFYCVVDREGNLIEASEKDEGKLKVCNDILWSLIKETNRAWPLGYWERYGNRPWSYHGTRQDEQALLEQLNDRYHRMVSKVHVRSNLYNNQNNQAH